MAILVAEMFLADDRRTASSWFVAAGVQDDWDRFYDCLISIGRTSGKLSTEVLGLVVQKRLRQCRRFLVHWEYGVRWEPGELQSQKANEKGLATEITEDTEC